jgi:hypothetical protein
MNPYQTPQSSPEREPGWKLEFIPGPSWLFQIAQGLAFATAWQGLRFLLYGSFLYQHWLPNAVLLAGVLGFPARARLKHRRAVAVLQASPPVLRGERSRVCGPAWGPLGGKYKPGSLWLIPGHLIFLPRNTKLGKMLVIRLADIAEIRTRPWLGARWPATLIMRLTAGTEVRFTVSRPRRWKKWIMKLAGEGKTQDGREDGLLDKAIDPGD